MLGAMRKAIDLQWPLMPLRPFAGRYNPFDLSYRRDPYAHLDKLRAAAPVYYSRPIGTYLVSSYTGVQAVLRDQRFHSDRKLDTSFRNRMTYKMAGFTPKEAAAFDATLTAAAPEAHHRMRAAISGDFSKSRIERLRPRMEFWIDRLLDKAEQRGEMDLIADFAGPLPVLVAAELLGYPPEDADRLQEWSDSYILLVDPLIEGASLKRMRRAYNEFDAYIGEIMKRKESEPGDDLISRLLERRAAGDLSDLEVRTLALMLMVAGHEVITNLVGNAIASLLRFPDQRERLQKDPELMDSALEEFIRLESPIQSAWRIAKEEIELDGTVVPAGRAVTALIGGANHDPAQFEDPHTLDIGRADNRHLGFALGSHYCVGPWLARVEGGAALSRFLERFPDFSGDATNLRWKPAMGLRGLYELPISLGRRAGAARP
jgi:pimeloyl-[acyl-carrier protein] synthase